MAKPPPCINPFFPEGSKASNSSRVPLIHPRRRRSERSTFRLQTATATVPGNLPLSYWRDSRLTPSIHLTGASYRATPSLHVNLCLVASARQPPVAEKIRSLGKPKAPNVRLPVQRGGPCPRRSVCLGTKATENAPAKPLYPINTQRGTGSLKQTCPDAAKDVDEMKRRCRENCMARHSGNHKQPTVRLRPANRQLILPDDFR